MVYASAKLFFLLGVLCSLVYGGNIVNCCDTNLDPGVPDEEWFLYSPPDIIVQCHLNLGLSIPDNVDPNLTGYGWEINGCNFLMSTICGGGDVWCFQDNDDGAATPGQDDDTVGLGANAPLRTWSDSAGVVSCGLSQTFVRTWGSISTCNGAQIFITQVVGIIDDKLPTLCTPEDMTYECGPNAPVLTNIETMNSYFGAPDVVDHCEALDDSDINQLTPTLAGNVITRTFVVGDGCQTVTQTQFITLVDTSAPILERLPNVRLECPVALPVTVPTTVDLCFASTIPAAPTNTDVTFLGDCPGQYSIERTWRVADSFGNIAYETQIIVVDDTTPPAITPAVLNNVNVLSVSCFDDIIVGVFTQDDPCSGVESTNVPFEISLSHNENEARTEVLVRYTSGDACGNSRTWAELWQVDSGIGVFSDVISGPTVPVAKASIFTIVIDIIQTNDCAPFGILLIDAGPATLVSVSSSPCFFQSGTGLIYCDPVPGTVPNTLTVDLTVPSTFIGSDLIISVSWQYNYQTIGVLVGSYVVSFI